MMRLAVAAGLLVLALPRPADACGGYIAPRTEGLRINDAIELVVVRAGTHTELSVRNRYRGPVEDFALLVPVPQVLHAEDVHTLDASVFDALNAMTSPQLTYLRELDPCANPDAGVGDEGSGPKSAGSRAPDVQVEAAFQVAEYDIEVLSATDAAGLDAWLHDHHYQVPDAMAPLLRPYVESNSKFFVAKVDPARVKFVDGVATLSPLRFGYDADEVSLPLRLSTANSPGLQDVLVHTIAAKPLEAANRPNTRIPTGLQLRPGAAFGAFYDALLADTLAHTPDAVITEFSGQAWPTADILTALGAMPDPAPPTWGFDGVITRLHLRLDQQGTHDDLVLREAASTGTFLARYEERAPWTGPVECKSPSWDRWSAEDGATESAAFGAAVRRTAPPLASFLAPAAAPHPTAPSTGAPRRRPRDDGGCCDTGGAPGSTVVLLLVVLVALRSRRSRS